MDDPLGKFAEGFLSYRRMLASAAQDARFDIFCSLASEVATYVEKGLSRVVAADELADIAICYELTDIDGVQSVLSSAFGKIQEPEDEEPKANGHDKTAPIIRQPGRPLEMPALLPARQWLHARHYVRRHIVMTVAPGGYGKSSLLLINAIELTLGRGLIGANPNERVRTWYWNAEEPEIEEIYRRIAAICLTHRVNVAELNGELFLSPKITGDDWRFAWMERGKIMRNDALINLVIDYIGDNRIGCLMLDPMIQFHRLPENDTSCMEYLIKSILQPIAIATNCCIELSHHTRKAAQGFTGEVTVDESRGAGAAVAAARSARVLNRMTKDEAETAGISSDQRSLYLRVSRDKANMAPPANARWVRLASVDIGNGDNVQAVVPWTFPQPFDGVTVESMHFMRAQVARGQYMASPRSPAWVGLPLMEHLGLNKDDTADRKRARVILDKWFATGVLEIEVRMDGARRPRDYVIAGNWKDEIESMQPSLL
jgi:AAA domain